MADGLTWRFQYKENIKYKSNIIQPTVNLVENSLASFFCYNFALNKFPLALRNLAQKGPKAEFTAGIIIICYLSIIQSVVTQGIFHLIACVYLLPIMVYCGVDFYNRGFARVILI